METARRLLVQQVFRPCMPGPQSSQHPHTPLSACFADPPGAAGVCLRMVPAADRKMQDGDSRKF